MNRITPDVLIVEDNDQDFALAEKYLATGQDSAARPVVRRARTLAECLQTLAQRPADMVLLDLSLPDSSGWDTFARFRHGAGDQPVILLTNTNDEAGGIRALSEGAQDYLVKDRLTDDGLVRSIRYAMERNRVETELRKQQSRLEQTVAERSRELKRANEQMLATNHRLAEALEQLKAHERDLIRYERISALGQMAGGIMRDFNNLLMPIVGFSEMFLESPEIIDNRHLSMDMLKRIRDAALKATEVIRRMRQFYSPADDESLSFIEVNAMIERFVENARPKWEDASSVQGGRIVVTTDFDVVPPIRGRETQLREALTNLLLNAIDAMPNGGAIVFRTIANGEQVSIEVSDTGKGMPDHVRERCFEPFYSTKGAEATGLGLAMVYGIVRDHGGDVQIKSEENQGTSVTLNLPACLGNDRNGDPKSGEKPFQPLRILVIDDDEAVCNLLRTYFLQCKHVVETATTADEGVRKQAEGKFDVVITDRMLPDGSGEDVALAVKQRNASVPVIMLTGAANTHQAGTKRPEGVDEVVAKPVAIAELRRIVEEIVRIQDRGHES